MDSYTTEEEQIQAIKKWWAENGVSTIAGIAIAIAAVFGWRFYQDGEQAKLEASSFAYEELIQALATARNEPNDINIATADHLANQIKETYGDSGYAYFAAFFRAQQAVSDEDYALAEQELNWVLDSGPSEPLRQAAQLRLARVVFAQDRSDEALALLAVDDAGAYGPVYLETQGDIHLQLEQHQQAVDAYESAQALSTQLEINEPPTLSIKLTHARTFL